MEQKPEVGLKVRYVADTGVTDAVVTAVNADETVTLATLGPLNQRVVSGVKRDGEKSLGTWH